MMKQDRVFQEKEKNRLSPSCRQRICELAARWAPEGSKPPRIISNTTDFIQVQYGDVVFLGDIPYLVRHNAKESGFGLDDEVKFWVKRAIDLYTGKLKIIKLVFHERFNCSIGDISFECFRSPRKEARILELIARHPNFMHGFSVSDEKNNLVRIIDFINGRPIYSVVDSHAADHEKYFFEQFPTLLNNYMECIRAIGFLHEHGEKHGDIRRDHIMIDRDSGIYRWIDFDYNYRHRENIFGYDLFGLGNILIFLAGGGDVLIRNLRESNPEALTSLTREDVNIVFNHRVANLRKIFPYLPEALNRILLHFSMGSRRYYEKTTELLDDLEEYRSRFPGDRGN